MKSGFLFYISLIQSSNGLFALCLLIPFNIPPNIALPTISVIREATTDYHHSLFFSSLISSPTYLTFKLVFIGLLT